MSVCKTFRFLLVLVWITLMTSPEVSGNIGREFVVGFITQYEEEMSGSNNLYITSRHDTVVRVEVPFLSMNQTYHVTIDNMTTIELNGTVRMTTVTGMERKGVRITSDHDIAVYGVNMVSSISDGFLGLPLHMVGTEYVVPSYIPTHRYSLVGIVASEDNTDVTVTLRTSGAVTYKGKQYGNFETITEQLNQLEVFQIGSSADLTGTKVESSKKVAVFSGNQCAKVQANVCEHLVEQIPPVNHWGSHHVTSPTAMRRAGDVFRVLAAFNETAISVGGSRSSLDQGDFAEYDIPSNDSREILCDKPCLVVKYNKGQDADSWATVPFMTVLPPVSKYTSAAVLATPLKLIGRKCTTFIGIVMNTSDTSGLLVDDQLHGLTWEEIRGTDFSRTFMIANKTNYKISHQSKYARFLTLVSGHAHLESFGFPGSWYEGRNSSETCRPSLKFPDDVNQTCRDSISANSTGLPSVRYNLCDVHVRFTYSDTFASDGRCPGVQQALRRQFTGVDSFGRKYVHEQTITSFPTNISSSRGLNNTSTLKMSSNQTMSRLLSSSGLNSSTAENLKSLVTKTSKAGPGASSVSQPTITSHVTYGPTSVRSAHSAAKLKEFVHHTATAPLESITPLLVKSEAAQSFPTSFVASSIKQVYPTSVQSTHSTVESKEFVHTRFKEILKTADPKNKSSLKLVMGVTDNLVTETAEQDGASTLSASSQVEDFALEYAANHLNESAKIMTIRSKRLVLQIENISPNHNSPVTVPKLNNTDNVRAVMKLPPGVFGNQSVNVVSIVYKNVNGLFRQGLDNSHSLGSNIIAVAVDDSIKLQKKVAIEFTDLPDKKLKDLTCVYWRPRRGGSTGGDWVDDGCSLSPRTGRHAECSCDHMTHFAVLMQLEEEPENTSSSEIHERVLTALTYGGLGISSLGNVLSIGGIGHFLNFRKEKAQIRLGLVVSLYFSQTFFMIGINAKRYRPACISFAVVTKYFLVATFAWMFLEGVQLYRRVTSVFKKRQKMLLYHAFGWLVPLCLTAVPVIIAAYSDGGIDEYVSDKICWVRPGGEAYWTFIAFISLVTLINCFIFGQALRVVIQRKRSNSISPFLDNFKKTARTCLILFPLLGLTWIIGFVTLPLDHVAPKYIFVILNSAQGFLVFFFNTWRWDEVTENLTRVRRLQQVIMHKRNEVENRKKVAGNENLERPQDLSLEDIPSEASSDSDNEAGLPREHIVEIEIHTSVPWKNLTTAHDDKVAMKSAEDTAAEDAGTSATTKQSFAINIAAAPPGKRHERIELQTLKCHTIDVADDVEEITVTSPGDASRQETPAQAFAHELRIATAKRRAPKKRRGPEVAKKP